jgi:hypothetical protein
MRVRVSAAALTVAVALPLWSGAVAEGQQSIAGSTATSGGTLVLPASRALVGDYVGAQGPSGTTMSVSDFENMIGRPIGIDSHFVPWSFSRVGTEQGDITAGRVPLVAWSAGSNSASTIASGQVDTQIRAAADALRSLRGTVLLRFAYEMDHTRIGTPSETIAAWRHVRAVFQQENAANVQFVWCVTARGVRSGKAQTYYPGDDYVDWLAVDGYNRYPNDLWRSPDWLFGPFYSWASTHPKPLMIAESGSTEDPADPTRKADWFTQLGSWVLTHPAVQAWVYTDSYTIHGYDMRIDTTANAKAAYVADVGYPYFVR